MHFLLLLFGYSSELMSNSDNSPIQTTVELHHLNFQLLLLHPSKFAFHFRTEMLLCFLCTLPAQAVAALQNKPPQLAPRICAAIAILLRIATLQFEARCGKMC
jgi:hypothetical protein